jgi:TP901 family phage tail tape measure protein
MRDVIFTILAIDEASKVLEKTGLAAEESSHKFGKLGQIGSKAFAAFGLGAAAAAYEGVKMASEFQTSVSLLSTGAGESRANLDLVSKGMLDMAGQVGTGANELAKAMYLVESAGYHGADGLKVLQAAAEGAKTDGADVTEVGNALTTVMTDMHAPAASAATVMSQMVAAVGQGKMKMNDLAGSIHSVLPNAAALGLSFAQTGGALATMTAQGMSADQAAQNLNHTIVKLAAPTAGMTSSMARYGLSAQDVAKNLGKNGLTGTLDTIVKAITSHMGPAGLTLISTFNKSKAAAEDAAISMKALPPASRAMAESYAKGTLTVKDWRAELKSLPADQAALLTQWKAMEDRSHGFSDSLKSGKPAAQTFTAALKDMLGDQTALQVALHLTGENAGAFNAAVKKIGGTTADSSGHVKDFAETQKNLTQQWNQAKASIQTLLIELGAKLIPILTKALTVINNNKTAVAALLITLAGIGTTVAVVKAATKAWEAMKVAAVAFKAVNSAAWWAIQKASLLAYAAAQKVVNLATIAWKEMQFWSVIAKAGAQWVIAGAKAVAYKVIQLAVSAATKAWAAAQWLLNVALDANPIGIVIVAIAALAAGIIYAYTHSETFRNIVNSVWAAVSGFVMAAVGKIKGAWSAMVSAGGVVIAWFQALPGKITGFLSGLPGQMASIGANIISSLAGGIASMAGHALDAVKNVVGGAIGAAKSLLGIASPSKVFKQIGNYVGEGFAQGLLASRSRANTEMSRLMDLVNKTGSRGAERFVKNSRSKLLSLWDRKAADDKALKADQERLKSLKDSYAQQKSSVRSSIVGSGDITQGEGTDFGSIVFHLKNVVNRTKQFYGVVASLRKIGLGSTLINELIAAGPDQALPYAQSILAQGKSGVTQLNGLTNQLGAMGNQLGTLSATNMYGAGISTTEGLIRGLKSKESALVKAMEHLARAMVKTLKKELGIKSPSAVFHEVGTFSGMGLVNGLVAQQRPVAAAAAGLLTAGSVSSARPSIAGSRIAQGGHTFIIQGAIDPAATARQIRRILDTADARGVGGAR